MIKTNKGITLVSLVITIILLLILAGVTIATLGGENGLFSNAKKAKEETEKAEAQEILNLKISSAYTKSYIDNEDMNLQYLANYLCENEENDVQYVGIESGEGSLVPPTIGEDDKLYVKLVKYPYEFEINQELKISKIDGIEIADSTENNDNQDDTQDTEGTEDNAGTVTLTQQQIEELIDAKVNEKLASYSTTADIESKYATKEYVDTNLSKYSDLTWTLLCSTSETSFVEVWPTIDQYNYIAIVGMTTGGYGNPYIISVQQFKTLHNSGTTAINSYSPIVWAQGYWDSSKKSVMLRAGGTNSVITACLYGIK